MKNLSELEYLSEEQISFIRSISDEFNEIPGKCAYSHMTSEYKQPRDVQGIVPDTKPAQVKGIAVLLLVKGKLFAEVNTRKLEVEGPVLIVFDYGSLVRVKPIGDDTSIDLHLLLFSPAFLRDINISYSAFSGEAFIEHDDPTLRLQEREVSLLMRYFSLMNTVMKDNYDTQMSLHIVNSMTTALIYQLMSIVYRRVRITSSSSTGPRRNSYVQDFLRLVHLHYLKERSVSFYADQLFISPKYLSLLVKEATGRSAARWIDYFVIMEAKNLLRYSGKNVQQVAYALNFSNQSAFGKYFKHITGLSPTDYQKS
ncbi:MAG: AraC family transcriptional regulator [Muribaculaceae bacterium]|nr:AraC family transcriptional regulator [Muribaculaceae bacterium]